MKFPDIIPMTKQGETVRNDEILKLTQNFKFKTRTYSGSSALNPGAVFLRFFRVAFLLFLTPAVGSNPAGPTF